MGIFWETLTFLVYISGDIAIVWVIKMNISELLWKKNTLKTFEKFCWLSWTISRPSVPSVVLPAPALHRLEVVEVVVRTSSQYSPSPPSTLKQGHSVCLSGKYLRTNINKQPPCSDRGTRVEKIFYFLCPSQREPGLCYLETPSRLNCPRWLQWSHVCRTLIIHLSPSLSLPHII